MWPFRKKTAVPESAPPGRYDGGTFTFAYPYLLEHWREDDLTLAFRNKQALLGTIRVGTIPAADAASGYPAEKATVLQRTQAKEQHIGALQVLFDRTQGNLVPEVDLDSYVVMLDRYSQSHDTIEGQVGMGFAALELQQVSTYYWFFGVENQFFRWSYRIFTALENEPAVREELRLLTEEVFPSIRLKVK